jgi:hypothetical protein
MPAPLYQGNCGYTPITAAGTTTLNPGPAAGPGVGLASPATFGAFYGASWYATGTTFAITVYDVQTTVNQNGTTTVTNTLMNGTGTAGQVISAGPPGVGVRYKGALVCVTTGTPGGINALWD